jgi:hypothetical protein
LITASPPTPRIVLFGRTPCLLVMSMVPSTRMTSGPTVSMASSSSSVVSTVTVAPPTPLLRGGLVGVPGADGGRLGRAGGDGQRQAGEPGEHRRSGSLLSHDDSSDHEDICVYRYVSGFLRYGQSVARASRPRPITLCAKGDGVVLGS